MAHATFTLRYKGLTKVYFFFPFLVSVILTPQLPSNSIIRMLLMVNGLKSVNLVQSRYIPAVAIMKTAAMVHTSS